MFTKDNIFLHSLIGAAVFFWVIYFWSDYIGRNDESGLLSTAGFFAGLFFSPIVFIASVIAGFIVFYLQKFIKIPLALCFVILYSPAVFMIILLTVINN